MRYENWDVLLFPEISKVPIQEFKTQCTVTRGRDSHYTANPSVMGSKHGNSGLLPVLTTYIPGLSVGTSFRASIHSWEKPRPSPLMGQLMQPDDTLLFQAQVYIDGEPVSGCVFGQRSIWPHIIDLTPRLDKNGNQQLLRFPPFHESLKHGINGHGRIVVVIAEGFGRPGCMPPIERVRDIIAFSFQHAPLDVLELNKIAWPNPSMWEHAPHSCQYNSGSVIGDPKESQDTHTHSPTKHERRAIASTSVRSCNRRGPWAFRSPAIPPLVGSSSQTDPNWSNEESDTDPFNPFSDNYTLSDLDPHHSARNSGDDISMPDYQSSSSSSRAISSMTGISYDHSKQPSLNDILNDQHDQVFRSFGPPKEPVSGVQTPAEAPSTLPISFKGAEARPAASSNAATRRSISSILKDMSHPGVTRDMSGFQARSVRRVPFDALVGDSGTDEIYAMPTMYFRTRRMPVSNGRDNEDSLKTPRQRNDQTHHSTPTKAPVRDNVDVAKGSNNPNDPSLGSTGNVAIPQSDRFGDDLDKDGFKVDHYVESKPQAREVSAGSSVL